MKEQLLKKVETILAKEEIAQYKQFLLLWQRFQKLSAAQASVTVCMWEKGG